MKVDISDTFIGTDSNDNSQLSKVEYDAIKAECMHYEDMRSVSIEALKIIQKNRGWISDEAIELIAKMLCISVTDVEGVATFYNQIFRQPVGRHIIRYCDSAVCYIVGYKEIQKSLMHILKVVLGGTTTDNRFTLLPTCCLGACDKAPVIMINQDIYFVVTPKIITQLLEQYL